MTAAHRVLSFLFVVVVLSAQTKAPPPGKLRAVHIKGNTRYTAADIIAASGLKTGQPVTGEIFEEARTKLLATDLFTNVVDNFRFVGRPPLYELTFEVTENTQVYPFRFERLPVDAPAAREYLRKHVRFYSEEIPPAPAVIDRYARAVGEYLSQKGAAVKVLGQVSNEDPNAMAVVFSSNAPAPVISRVIVSGNEAVDTGSLLRAINQLAIGTPLTDARINQILNGGVKPLYASRGYMAVTFPKIDTEKSPTDSGEILKVTIKEGPVFRFGSIRFHGSGLDQDEIRATIPYKPGQTFNGLQVDSFRTELEHRLRKRGYLDAKIVPDTQPDDLKRTVDVTYNVDSGAAYNFRNLEIHGLDILTEPVVRKLWGEKPGQPFNPEYPEYFLKRVGEEGIFDNLRDTKSNFKADAASHDVTVNLYFQGGKAKTTDSLGQPLPPDEQKRRRPR